MTSTALNILDHTIDAVNNKSSTTKNILITGGAGFIGSNTTIHLVRKYPHYQFVVVDKLSYSANIKNLTPIANANNYKFVHGSVTSKELMRHLFITHDINVVIHFAAETHVDLSFHHAFEFTNSNVMGTHILLECARRQMLQQDPMHPNSRFDLFIHVSTDEVYGESGMKDACKDAKTETDRLLPTNPYSASKAAAEQIVHSYSRSFKVPIIVTRSSNVYGPRQFPEKMIPKFVNLIRNGKPVCIYGEGTALRVYLNVGDAANAFDLLLHHGIVGEIYNITCDEEHNTVQMVRKLLECFDEIEESEYTKYIAFVEDRQFHDTRYYINGDKMKALGWKPQVAFSKGLKETVEWYIKHPNHWKNLDDVLVAHPSVYYEDNTVFGGDLMEQSDSKENDK